MRRILYDTDKQEIAEELIKLDYRNSPAILCTSKGETIAVNDSIDYKPKNIKLFGKGKQRQYEGNQLFDADNIVKKDATVENGVITITSDSADLYIAGAYSGTDVLFQLPQGNYMIGCSDSNVKISMYHKQGDLSDNIDTSKSLCTLSVNCSFIGIRVRSIDGTSLLGKSFTIMLNEGNVLKPFEPFVGNEPSPNMNYPQIPSFLGEGGSIEGKVLGKNHADTSKLKYWNGDDNVEKVDNGFYLKPTTEENRVVVIDCYMKKGNKYTLSYDIESLGSESANDINYYLTGVDNTQIYNAIISFAPLVFAPQVDIKEVAIYTSIHPNAILKITNVQVELGEVATEYEAPAIEQPFTSLTPNGLRGVPLGQTIPDAIKNSPIHMNGVYWDSVEQQYYIADTENEDGKDVQRIWKHTFTDFSTSYVYASRNGHTEGYYEANKKFVNFSNGLSDKFFFKMGGDEPRFANVNSTIYFTIKGEYSREEWIAKMEEVQPTIYLILAEPIVTETDSQHDVVMNYPNTTIVNDEGAYMEVEYVADTKCYIDNKFKELEANITSAVAQLL